MFSLAVSGLWCLAFLLYTQLRVCFSNTTPKRYLHHDGILCLGLG